LSLWKSYRSFTFFLLANVAQSTALLAFRPDTNVYAAIFFVFIPILGVAALLAVQELYAVVLRQYRGIGTLSRWAVSAGLVISFATAALSVYPEVVRPGEAYPVLLAFSVFERALSSALLFFIVLITGFLFMFPVPLSRNAVLHTFAFAVLFASRSVLLLIRNAYGAETARLLSTVNLAVECLCFAVWIVFLTRPGEEKTVVFGERWRGPDGAKLVGELEQINAALLRTARK
jgi:hypothetical protein